MLNSCAEGPREYRALGGEDAAVLGVDLSAVESLLVADDASGGLSDSLVVGCPDGGEVEVVVGGWGGSGAATDLNSRSASSSSSISSCLCLRSATCEVGG